MSVLIVLLWCEYQTEKPLLSRTLDEYLKTMTVLKHMLLLHLQMMRNKFPNISAHNSNNLKEESNSRNLTLKIFWQLKVMIVL